ncbi:hypothetical protein [Paenibacillus chitinolyticus]|uniref:hypothetical protein n=1 Tax=Paenibacillus chitinolyticus TaxID=79263 RepID=UPI001C4778B5|nr:hypothetical protein [Paenibacillus chitinolyticus]MBV6712503.1 hypothetical protein [Paenibacillus chitinolyticus]
MDILSLKRDRDAWATIRGYVYQVDLTLEHWIHLNENEVLELERGEDIDVVEVMSGVSGRTLNQVKHREKKLTLRSSEAQEAMINYFEHRQENPSIQIAFRFITNSEITVERPPLFVDKRPGIAVWEHLRINGIADEQSLEQLLKIRSFLASSNKPKSVDQETWNKWYKFLSESTNEELIAYVRKFSWSPLHTSFSHMENIIEDLLIRKEIASSSWEATAIYERLFLYVFKFLSNSGIKRLTKTDLNEQSYRVIHAGEEELLAYLRLIWKELEVRVDVIERNIEDQQSQVEILNTHMAKLKKEVGFQASISLDVQRPLLDIPEFHRSIMRHDLVNSILEQMKTVPWLALQGDLGSGKTQLAALVARRQGYFLGWVRLLDLTPIQASLRIDDALAAISGIPPKNQWQGWYLDVCNSLKKDSLLVLDDLPRTNGKTILDEKLVMLSNACKLTGINILSTSAFSLSPALNTLMSEGVIKLIEVPKLENYDIAEILTIYQAPNWLIESDKMLTLITSLTKGHPVLATAVVHYLQERNWKVDEKSFSALFTGDYISNLNAFVQQELLDRLEDPETREFLYRLTLVQAPFDIEQIRMICEVTPLIPRPMERLAEVSGLWIQRDTDISYQVSPLLAQLGPMNLDTPTKKQVRFVIGQNIIKKHEIHPLDAIRAIGHFVAAEAYREAGLTLLVSLEQIEKHEAWNDVWGFTRIWVEAPLPEAMDLNMKLAIRMKQITVLNKMHQPVDDLLNKLDILLATADMRDIFVSAISLFVATFLALRSPEKANKYISQALNTVELEIEQSRDEDSSLFDTFHPAILIWLTGAGVRNGKQLANWLDTLESLTVNQLQHAKQNNLYADTAIHLCDRIWLQEVDKPENDRDWHEVITQLEKVAKCASKLNLDLLWACSIRGTIIVLAEYQKNLQSAEQFANNALNCASVDPIIQYLIREAMGRQFVYQGQLTEAISWLSIALQTEISKYQTQQVYSYIELSKAFGGLNPIQAIYFTGKAVEISTKNDVPEVLVVKALGEHVIALWLADAIDETFRYYETAVEILLKSDKNQEKWRSLFVSFGHASGYIMSLITSGKPPEATRYGDIYVAPERGFFVVDHPLVASVYKPENDFFLAAHLANLCEYLNKPEKASYWILQAFDIARHRGAGRNIGLLGSQALPILLQEGQFALALDVALEMQTIFAMYSHGMDYQTDPIQALGSKPNENWYSIEQSAAEDSIVLAALRLLQLLNRDPERATDLALEITALCKQMTFTASSMSFWKTMDETIDALFTSNLSFTELSQRGNIVPHEWRSIKFLYYVGASLKASPGDALRIYRAISPLLEGRYQRWEKLYRLIIIPFVTEYWVGILTQFRHQFLAPEFVYTSLKDFSNYSDEMTISKLLDAVKFGLYMEISP